MTRCLLSLLFTMLFRADYAAAKYLDFKSDPKSAIATHNHFLSPNEGSPADAMPMLEHAKPGVHLSVGTERGFIHAAMSPGATHLLLVDLDIHVVNFNRMNIGLLQIARDRKDYLHLRLTASHEEILARLAAAPAVDADSAALLRTAKQWDWWRQAMKIGDFPLFHAAPLPEGEFAFKGANYLHYDDQFAKISALAKGGKIEAHLVDLSEAQQVRKMVESVQRAGLKIGVLDISNAWWENHMYPGNVDRLLRETRKAGTAETLYVFTTSTIGVPPLKDPRSTRAETYRKWRHFGFTGKRVDEILESPLVLRHTLEVMNHMPTSNRLYPTRPWAGDEKLATVDDEEFMGRVMAAVQHLYPPCKVKLKEQLMKLVSKGTH